MKRTLRSLVASAVAFFICWHAVAFVLRTKGPHTWFDSHIELGRLHFYIEEFRGEDGELPSSGRVNEVIQRSYIAGVDQEVFERSEDSNFLLYHLAREVSEKRLLRLWDDPPVYVRDDSLPGGYGFYLAGEDGISKTSGKDRDDINSWDQNSYQYYFEKLHRQRALRNSIAASVPALLVFGLLIKWPKKITAQQDADAKPD